MGADFNRGELRTASRSAPPAGSGSASQGPGPVSDAVPSAASESALPPIDWPSACAVIIPCLDEGRTIGPLVTAIRTILPVVIVIDDGSRDGTSAAAAGAGAELIRHEQPLGKGSSLRRGWRRAGERGFSWALSLDGDGQHAASDIPLLLDRAQRTHAALVVGNRMGAADTMPPLRRWTNRWLSRRLSALALQEFPDSQCGFRLVRLDALAKVVLETQRFEIESEVLVRFAAARLPIEFVPVQVRYGNQRSKIRLCRDSWRWWRWWRTQTRQQARSAGDPAVRAVGGALPAKALDSLGDVN